MRYAAVVPYAAELEFAELATVAEGAGWDAVLTWEAVFGQDPWSTIGAAAMVTQRIRLGVLLTPVPARRPWELAAQIGSIDRLSNGRLTVAVGLGAVNANWLSFLPDEGRATRASQLDEGLEVVTGLLRGQPFEHQGEHWRVREVTELAPPPPVQRPHPPIWCVGALVPGRERQPSLERAARWQGILPAVAAGQEGHSGITQDTLREIVERVAALRERDGHTMGGYDVVVEGDSHGRFGTARPPVAAWEEAGATWWVESWWDLPHEQTRRPESVAETRRRLEQGPPR
jgi:alkanesulfonate monooxygenase SsuD/methylene tetrahydromethanopterin reductase-like flavin-dependent oxidoreductase (luciferase family)